MLAINSELGSKLDKKAIRRIFYTRARKDPQRDVCIQKKGETNMCLANLP